MYWAHFADVNTAVWALSKTLNAGDLVGSTEPDTQLYRLTSIQVQCRWPGRLDWTWHTTVPSHFNTGAMQVSWQAWLYLTHNCTVSLQYRCNAGDLAGSTEPDTQLHRLTSIQVQCRWPGRLDWTWHTTAPSHFNTRLHHKRHPKQWKKKINTSICCRVYGTICHLPSTLRLLWTPSRSISRHISSSRHRATDVLFCKCLTSFNRLTVK